MTGLSGLVYDRYPIEDRQEWLMRIGAPDASPILLLPPLFEELNRTRALIALVMRDLAARGFCCWLPDLPGTGESERPLETCTWEDWRNSARAAGEYLRGRAAIVSIRGGCLLDDAAPGRNYWRFAPAKGSSLARDLARSGLVASGGSAGYGLGEDLTAALKQASPQPVAPLRTARLASAVAEADVTLEGPSLWRRSEPGNSPELGAAIASDISEWIARCDAS